MSPTEIFPDYSTCIDSAFWCGSVRIVGAKKPEDSLLCACDVDTLTDGKRLKMLRLRAGLTIRQAAEAVGICRHTLMNYESGRAEVKAAVRERLVNFFLIIEQHRLHKDLFLMLLTFYSNSDIIEFRI